MGTLLLKNASMLVTMDDERRTIADGAIFAGDNVIEMVGATPDLPTEADRVIDATGMVVLPGLINTHHHLYQTLTRALPAVENANLFDWLTYLYPIWAELTAEAIYHSALVGLAELLLSGCTTVSDHLYLVPHDSRHDDEIRAARELGVRFHPCRGSMSLGQSRGGLPPDSVVETEDAILADCERLLSAFHNPQPYSMLRLVVAPCSPFSVTGDSMKRSAAWARQHGLAMHTHVAETLDEEKFCLQKFGCRPVEYMRRLDWMGSDVWYAHAVHLNQDEIELMAETGTGVAHCPSSNMRLGSGIAPIREMLDAGVKVSLGVDGSASNDSSHMLAEARQALLLQRVTKGAAALTVEETLEMATLGGAKVLGRDDLGSLQPGKAADFVGVTLDRLEFAGAACHNPVATLLMCTPPTVDLSVINGRIVVEDGQIPKLDMERIVARQNEIALDMVRRAK
jgi:cytosine/adenosine deaminase-related metal-dependent hydrolase